MKTDNLRTELNRATKTNEVVITSSGIALKKSNLDLVKAGLSQTAPKKDANSNSSDQKKQ